VGLITHRMSYAQPRTIGEAADLLARSPDTARVLAGGQSLIPLMKLEFAQPEVLVDISRVPGLDDVREGPGDTLEIGAMVRHDRVHHDPVIQRRLPLLSEVARLVGDPQVRTLGTFGGVLAHADPAGDYCMLALALDARILTNRREISAEEFFEGPFTTALQPGEFVTGGRFPASDGRHAFEKIAQMPFDSGVPSVAVQWLQGAWRVGLTNMGHDAARARAVEAALADGATPSEAVGGAWNESEDTSEDSVPRSYRLHMARVLTQRALERADRSGEDGR
jgi:aerobic carbon-monoxide dehydrogenase medium subunit